MNAATSQKNNRAIRLLILDDHPLVREGIGRLLEAEPDIQVAGQCASVGAALEAVRSTSCDVVLLDYDLGLERGTEFLRQVRETSWTGRVLVITAGVTDRQAVELLDGGADGIFHKTSPPEDLIDAIRHVTRGERWLGEPYRRRLEEGIAEPTAAKQLTNRERQVLRAVVEGMANKEIAGLLDISESSVKAALQQLFFKTGVRTRSQLVRLALERYRDEVL
jgi:two-component system nitrate/nitrite response regulator NarL